MSIMIEVVAKKNYSLIGRVLYKTRPEVATEMETMITPGAENDITRIFYFYSRFDSFDLPGYNKVNKRRLFTAVMLQLYHPSCFTSGLIKVKYGFVKNIAACFDSKQQAISRNIKDVIIMYRAYEDFGDKVNEIIVEFKKESDGANA